MSSSNSMGLRHSYNHNPETDVGNDQVTLIWEIQVHAYKEAKASIPDIINKDHIL